MDSKNSTVAVPVGDDNVKLSWRERISFGQLDMAGQLVFDMITVYLLYFFTDVAMIPVGTAGTILLVARVFDALDAPIWGSLIDITHTRWGKARPYFLWISIPFAVSAILTFWAPGLPLHARIMYCAITYIFTGVLYTGINTPLATILPLLTRNTQERLTLNSIRLTFGQIGVLIVNAFALPLVGIFGQGDEVKGFRYTIVLFAIVGLALTLFSFFNTKERVKPEVTKVPITKSVKAMKKNWPWLIIVISNLALWIALTSRSSTIVYYMTYNFATEPLKEYGFYQGTEHRTIKYLNNLIEQDHRPVKRRNKFYRSLRTASTTIKGMEAIRGLYKKTRKEGTLFGFSVCTEIKVLLGIPA